MVAEVAIRITADGKAVVVAAQQATDALQGISNQAGKTSTTLQDTQKSSAGLNASFADMGKAGIVFAAVNSAASGLLDVMTRLPTSGIQFAAQIEVTNVGMAGILSSMTAINGRATTYAQGLEIASGITAKLQRDAMLTAASTKELVNAFQAMVGPGLAAGMSLDQIRQFATVGVNAVKSLGMEGTQIVQELRDLVQGGITPASSTLATALGLKDSDIAKAKASSEGLFSFLMGKMKGFAEAGPAYAQTFTGVMEQMQEQLVKSAATVFAPLAGTLKDQAKGITDALGNETNVAQLSKLTGSIQLIAGALGSATQFAIAHSEAIVTVVQVYGALKMGVMVAGWVASTEAMLQASAASRLVAMQAAAEAVANTEVTLTARQKIAAYLAELAAKQASAEATVAETAGKIAFLNVSVAALELSRSEVVAKMASTRSTIAQAQAQLAAAQAAGAQSFALAMAAEATNTLSVAQARQSVLMAEMTLLGQQQTGVHAAIAAATAAQTLATEGAALATNQLGAAQRAASVSGTAMGSVIGALGGPVGIAIAAVSVLVGVLMAMNSEADKAAKTGLSKDRVDTNNAQGKKSESRDTSAVDQAVNQLKDDRDKLLIEKKNPGVLYKLATDQKNPGVLSDLLKSDYQIGMKTQMDAINGQITALEASSATAAAIVSKTGTEVQINGATATKALDDLLGKEKTVTSLTAKAKEETAALVSELAKVKLNTNVSPEVAAAKENEVAEAKKAIAVKLQGDLKQLREKGMGEAQAQANAHYGVTKAEAEKQAAIALQGIASLEMANELGYRGGLKSEEVYFADKLALRLKSNAAEQAANQTKIDEETRRMGAKSMNPAARDGVQAALIALETKAIELRTKALALEGDESVRVAELKKKAQNSYDADIIKIAAKAEGLTEETNALQLQTQEVARHGVVIDSVATLLARETAQRYENSLAVAVGFRESERARGASVAELAGIEEAITQLARLKAAAAGVAGASAGKDVAQAGLDQAKRLLGDKSADPFKDWGNTLRETFATAGDGLARMVDAMGALSTSSKEYGREMVVINALREKGGDSNIAAAAANERALIKKTESSQLNAYASMAGAAKTYFKEGSLGYTAMAGAEKALRTYQLVMSAQVMAKDLMAIGAKVSAWLIGDAAITTSAVASAAVQVPANMAVAGSAAVAAVATQGEGDPYTAFPRIAAMIAIMAGIGLLVGGGGSGGGSTSYDSFSGQAANTGTGTVFGDSSAQSESIKNSLSALESIARPELSFTSQMVMLLRSIDDGISGTTNALLSSGFDAMGSSFNGTSSSSGGGIAGAIFGSSSSSTSLSDLGLSFAKQSIAQAMEAVQVQQYQVTRHDSSSSGFLGFGSSSSTSYSTSMGSVDASVSTAMSRVVGKMLQAVTLAGEKMGASPAQLASLQGMDTGLGKVSLNGKTGAEIEKLLSAVFSAMGDKMAVIVAPSIGMFQKMGEGYLETLTRVSSGMEQAAYFTDRLGIATASLESVQNKQGDVASELVRQSIAAYEALSGISGIIQTFSGTASDLVDLYANLVNVRVALISMGQSAGAVTVDLVKGAGSIDALKSGMESFQQSFLTDAEQAAAQQARLVLEFANMAVAMPTTADAFKALVQTTDATTAAGQKQLGQLLAVSGSFKSLLDAQDKATQAQRDLVTALLASGKSISQWLANLSTSALGLSTPATKTADTRSDYLKTLGLARGNDKDALNGITGTAQNYLQAAYDGASSQSQYAAVLAQVKSEMGSLPAVVGYQQQTVDALDALNATSLLQLGGVVTTAGNTTELQSTTYAQLQATLALNNQTMFAVSANTSKALDYFATHGTWLAQIAASTASIAANPVVVNQASGGGSGSGGGLLGAALGFAGGVVSSIFGGLFADGDVFGGTGIYTNPTPFSFNGGKLGVMGEAGPEAVMPLERMPDGALGVRATQQLFVQSYMAGGGSGSNSDVVAELRALRAEVQGLRYEARATAEHANKTSRLLARVTKDGEAMQVVAAA